MDESARYFELRQQGRDRFMREAAEAVLVRRRRFAGPGGRAGAAEESDTTVVASKDDFTPAPGGGGVEVHPLEKKPGAPFSDMITVGRTANNDVVLNDVTVSRFHAYFKSAGKGWKVCDAGSKNGTQLAARPLEARKEMEIGSGQTVKFGDVAVTFYTASELYDALGEGEE